MCNYAISSLVFAMADTRTNAGIRGLARLIAGLYIEEQRNAERCDSGVPVTHRDGYVSANGAVQASDSLCECAEAGCVCAEDA